MRYILDRMLCGPRSSKVERKHSEAPSHRILFRSLLRHSPANPKPLNPALEPIQNQVPVRTITFITGGDD